jgi:hypothetical protein
VYYLVKGAIYKMPTWLLNILGTVGALLISLTVTFIFNKVVGLPKEIRKQKQAAEEAQKARDAAEAAWKLQHDQNDAERDAKISALQAVVDALPSYRAQSLQIQAQLQGTDKEILNALTDIKSNMLTNREILNERLDRLEDREKNAIRAKLIDEYRLFTDAAKNPMLAWSEMEHHAFFALVKDYEDLHGNDYVHKTVIPAMNELRVIKMSDRQELLKLMSSRKL